MAGIQIFIYTGSDSLSRAIVPSLANVNGVKSLPAAVIGSARSFELYLVSAPGTYDSRSGNVAYTPRLGAGPIGGVASGGTFTLGDGTETTAALTYDDAADDVQTALNALNSGAGPYGGTVTVTRQTIGVYTVAWTGTGSRALLQGVGSLLMPECGIVIDTTRTGDTSTRAEQTIRLLRQPVIYADGLTPIANGWSGTLSTSNARALALLAGQPSVTTDFEIELQGPSGPPEVIARSQISISNEIINQGALAADDLPQALLDTDPKIPRFFAWVTGLYGGTSVHLDYYGTDLPVGTLAIIGATVSDTIPGLMWQLKTSETRPAEGLTIVHVDGDTNLYWAVLGSGS